MREMYKMQGRKIEVSSIEEALALVRKQYPGAMKQGAVGAWFFYIRNDVKKRIMVAEAWLKGWTGKTWWLRIKDIDAKGLSI